MLKNKSDPALQGPSTGVLIAAFLAIWLPYEAAVGMQEHFHVAGPWGPLLMLVALLAAFAVAAWLARKSGANPFALRLDRWALPMVAGGVAAMVVARFAAAYAAVAGGVATRDTIGPNVVGSFAFALATGAVPALAEDILTRGFPLFAARSTRPAWLLILVSATMYTLNHIWRLDWGITEQVRLFCMGVAYALAAWRFGSLWAAFGLHLGWNAGAALVPIDIIGTDAFRIGTAVIHLIVAALVLFLPSPQRDS